ncbi:MAG: hypothetical protein ACREGE_01775 [Candidatus Microsaccharimonas sp.]
MPLPIRRDYIRNRQGTPSAGSWTIDVPRPINAIEGDWIIALLSIGASSAPIASVPGWTQIHYQTVNTRIIGVFARKYEEDDPTTYPITLNSPGNLGVEVSSMAIGDAGDIADWVIGSSWRRTDNGGSQATTQSPSITVPAQTLTLALEIEATNSIENDGSEVVSGATKWFGSPDQTTASVSIERVLVSSIEMQNAGATGTVTTTWPNAALNGAGIQIGIPYQESAPPTGEYISDTFERTLEGSWGVTNSGHTWIHGANTNFISVSDGQAHITIPTASSAAYGRIASELFDDIEMYLEWSVNILPVGANLRPRFVTRFITEGTDYHIRGTVTPAGVVDYRWYKADTATLGTTVTLPRTYTPNDVLKIRMQTYPDGVGITRLKARMWYGDEPEPTDWPLDITDSTPTYQAEGIIGLYAGYGAGGTAEITTSFNNLSVTPRPPEGTATTGNIGLHVIPHFSQTSLRVGAKFLQDTLANAVRIYENGTSLIDTETPTIPASKWAYVDFTDLTPNTEYTIKFFVDDIEQIDAQFTVRTLADEITTFKVVAGSCQFTGSSHPVFARMAEDSPAFIAHMGDLHYQNATDETAWRGAVENSLTSSTMAPLLEKTPFSWTWDNHDRIIVDTLNMGSTSPLTVPAWQELAGTTGWSSADTMGRSWTMGRVRFIQTDQWSVRDDPDLATEPRTFLGATQKQWWKDTLLASEEPVIVWFCQWTAQNHSNGRWNSFNAETTELEAWLDAHPNVKERLILVGGDSHQLQADSGTRTRAQGSRFNGVPSLNVSGFNRSSTGANGGNWDIAEGDLRLDTDPESNWGAYSRLTFADDGQNIDMLWEAVRVNAIGDTDIMASWTRKSGIVTIDGKPAIAQYYRSDQSRTQPLSIEIPEA